MRGWTRRLTDDRRVYLPLFSWRKATPPRAQHFAARPSPHDTRAAPPSECSEFYNPLIDIWTRSTKEQIDRWRTSSFLFLSGWISTSSWLFQKKTPKLVYYSLLEWASFSSNLYRLFWNGQTSIRIWIIPATYSARYWRRPSDGNWTSVVGRVIGAPRHYDVTVTTRRRKCFTFFAIMITIHHSRHRSSVLHISWRYDNDVIVIVMVRYPDSLYDTVVNYFEWDTIIQLHHAQGRRL
jgi:hypothetical protein